MINSSRPYLFKMLLGTYLLVSACTYADKLKLIDLVQQRNVSALENLLNERFIDLEKRDENGDTALLVAARTGDLATFDLLVEYGANINVLAANDRDILNLAVRISNPQLALHALKAGISTHTFTPTYQGSALIFASARGEVQIVDALIKAKAPLDRRNNLGWTALLEAVILGDGSKVYQDIVTLLLEAGADKNITDKLDKTPLDHAKQKKYNELVKLLVD